MASKKKWTELTEAELQKKEKSIRSLFWVFLPIIFLLFFFIIRDYRNGQEIDWSILTIAICSLAGPALLYPEWKSIREELQKRGLAP